MSRPNPHAASAAKSGLAPFAAVPGFSAVHEARSKDLGTFAIRLKSGDVCVFSPVAGLTERTRDSLLALGPAAVLFAPNHYHNKGLREYADAFPAARLVAPAAAIPRLEKVTGLSFAPADALAGDLPDGVTLLEPQGLKTGENWLLVREKNAAAWIVVDAFCGPPGSGSGSNEPQILKTFPRYGLADRDRYAAWVERQLRTDQPASLLPCHGRSIHDPLLP